MGCVSRFAPAAVCSRQQSFGLAQGRWGQVWGILIFGLKQRSAAGQGLGSSICSSLAMAEQQFPSVVAVAVRVPPHERERPSFAARLGRLLPWCSVCRSAGCCLPRFAAENCAGSSRGRDTCEQTGEVIYNLCSFSVRREEGFFGSSVTPCATRV